VKCIANNYCPTRLRNNRLSQVGCKNTPLLNTYIINKDKRGSSQFKQFVSTSQWLILKISLIICREVARQSHFPAHYDSQAASYPTKGTAHPQDYSSLVYSPIEGGGSPFLLIGKPIFFLRNSWKALIAQFPSRSKKKWKGKRIEIRLCHPVCKNPYRFQGLTDFWGFFFLFLG
jgi:hypothetical protein